LDDIFTKIIVGIVGHMETNPKDGCKKQERNCVWLVNKFLVNGAKSMGLSSM
jgi:hypothetical protein